MKYIAIVLLSFLFISFDAEARRGIIPFCSDCEYIEVTDDLPDVEDFQVETGEYLDLGYFYKQFWILWIPIWNFDGQYCLTDKKAETYYELSAEELEEITTSNNISMSSNPISFWNKIGGKIIIGILLGLIAWGYLGKSDDDDEVVASEDV